MWKAALGVVLLLGLANQAASAQALVKITNEWPTEPPPEAPAGYTAGAAFERLDAAATIRDTYDRFTELTRRSGQEIRFDLSDVKTYRPNEFGDLPLLEVMCPYRGEVLQTSGGTSIRRLPSEHLFSYRTSWVSGNSVGALSQIEAAAKYSFSEALFLEETQASGLWQGLVGVSTFRVTVEFESKTATNCAAVWWREYSEDLVVFHLNDNLAYGVAQYYADSFDPDQKVVPLERLSEQEPLPAINLPAGCVAESSTVSDNQRLDGMEGHSSGSHFSILNSQFECSSREDCTSRCLVVPRPWTCGDAGNFRNPLFPHRATGKPGQSQIVGAGLGAAAQCGFAIGCAVDECPFGICGVQPTITFNFQAGAGIEATVTGSIVSDQSVQAGVNCPPTRLHPALPPRCEEAVTSVVALPLGPPVEAKVIASPEPILLGRLDYDGSTHHGRPVSYLLEEWAVVQSGQGSVEVRKASFGFEKDTAKELALALWGKSGAPESLGPGQKVLLLAVPTHEANSRAINIPDLQLAPTVQNPTRERGQILVVADFAEDHRLQALHLAHTDTGAGSWKVMLALERALSLEPSAGGHRVITFAWVSVGETLKIESYLSYLPRCCCGDVFCA